MRLQKYNLFQYPQVFFSIFSKKSKIIIIPFRRYKIKTLYNCKKTALYIPKFPIFASYIRLNYQLQTIK